MTLELEVPLVFSSNPGMTDEIRTFPSAIEAEAELLRREFELDGNRLQFQSLKVESGAQVGETIGGFMKTCLGTLRNRYAERTKVSDLG